MVRTLIFDRASKNPLRSTFESPADFRGAFSRSPAQVYGHTRAVSSGRVSNISNFPDTALFPLIA
jgi:hypothetical protein